MSIPEIIELERSQVPQRQDEKSEADNARAGYTDRTEHESLSKGRLAFAIAAVTCSTLLSAIVNGMFTVALPTVVNDVQLDPTLILWPQSIVSVVSACTLLLCGSLSDVFGSKLMYILGSILQSAFILGSGVAQTGTQLLIMRAFMGLAQSICLPSSVSVVISTFPAGRSRNVAFSCMGGGQPVGFALGLVLGGVFTSTIGWRVGFYISAGLNAAVVILATFGLVADKAAEDRWQSFRQDIDWVGVAISSICLALLCYVLAAITADILSMRSATNIVLLCVSIVMIPLFSLWMRHQTAHGRPALIPNSFWSSRVFTSICISVLCTWGGFYATEQLLSLWLQLVQTNSALQTSVRFLPETIVGVVVNTVIGLSIHKVPCDMLVVVTNAVSLVSPILMAVSGPEWIYWAAAFPAICLIVVGPDTLYTVSNLLITQQFPENAQGLAGGVFNTAAQVGKTIGLALSGVIVTSVQTKNLSNASGGLVEAYRAGFWFCLGLTGLTVLTSFWGLRNVGRIGIKKT